MSKQSDKLAAMIVHPALIFADAPEHLDHARKSASELIDAYLNVAILKTIEKASQTPLDLTGKEWVKDSLWEIMSLRFQRAVLAIKPEDILKAMDDEDDKSTPTKDVMEVER